jgi:diguanylate cyclase (GGDEF)-like protein
MGWIRTLCAMIQRRYTAQVQKASAAIQQLGRAVRATRAFFIMRDRLDPSQPQIVACHPPLDEETLMRCFDAHNMVCAPVIDDASQHAWIGVTREGSAANQELAFEMTSVVAENIAGELRSIALENAVGGSRDDSTGLLDNKAFTSRVDVALAIAASEPDKQLAILVIDLDRYHRVMARFGEVGGQALIRQVAQRLEAGATPENVLARIGNDRFAIMIHRANAEAAAIAAAEQVHDLLKGAFTVAGEEIFTTASIGIALGSSQSCAGDLVRDADQCIAQLNAQGTGMTLIFRAGMHNASALQLLRERDVRHAVSRNEFTLHFQPIVDAARGGLHAFEALLRWRNPHEGLLPPSTFLDVLTETGLIDVVGRRVIREACVHAARWMALSGTLVPVSVNIVPAQLYAADFCDDVARILRDTGLPAHGLILELSESALVNDAEKAQQVLERLRSLGVRVYIDDFGTGYSSLSYLHDLPVTGIKLDKTFFRAIESSAKQREIVRSIVRLAHFMNMEVVAEGIETTTQLDAVRDLDCDLAQGFWFARPFDVEHATKYLAQQLARGQAA